MLAIIETEADQLARLISEGRWHIKSDEFSAAIKSLTQARKIIEAQGKSAQGQNRADYDFVIQQLALATYKSKQPTAVDALREGLRIISMLDPDKSNDTETVGIAGAIRKRLWDEEKQLAHLEKAVEYYGRGFNLQKDYYNGENYATCLVMRAAEQSDEDEMSYDLLTAKKTRTQIVEILSGEIEQHGELTGTDALWKYATLANALFGLLRDEQAKEYEEKFKEMAAADWEKDTYMDGKNRVLSERMSAESKKEK